MKTEEAKTEESTQSLKRFQNRVVIVVGAGSSGPGWGNGKATAVAFAREGAKVVAVDINESAALETVSLIQEEGNHAEAITADVTKHPEVKAVVNHCMEKYGHIDVMHYNVGMGEMGGCVDLSEENWHKVFDINVTGAFLFCKHVLPIMEKQGKGVILTTGSVAGIRCGEVDMVAYYTTKAALIQFTRAVAMRYAKQGIRAVSILPGLMNTPIIYSTYSSKLDTTYNVANIEEMVKKRDGQSPTGKMGDAWDIAHTAVFIASDEAKYITATEIIVDGGLTAKFT